MIKKILLSAFILFSFSSISLGEEDAKTLIMFTANWCKYCTIAKADMTKDDSLNETIKKYEIIIADWSKDKDMIEGYKIQTLPTFVVIQNKKEIKRKVGYYGPRDLNNFLR